MRRPRRRATGCSTSRSPRGLSRLLNPAFATGLDRRRIEVYAASACELPRPGASLSSPPAGLDALAWYEVYVQATSRDAGVENGRLPGVSFRSSRWLGATDMLKDLRFPVDANGTPDGDIEVPAQAALLPAALPDSDASFDAALDALGLQGWPPASGPRVSVLWKRSADFATWLCAGILVESPEPVHRAGRVDVSGLRLEAGVLAAPLTFDTVRRDRSGSRQLFLTATPFQPRAYSVPGVIELQSPRLALDVIDTPPGSAGPGPTVTGRLALPVRPTFAGEPT